jgi:hypothetical protein
MGHSRGGHGALTIALRNQDRYADRSRSINETCARGIGSPPRHHAPSPLRRKNDTEYHTFIRAYLPWSAHMRTAIRRDHVVDFVTGDRRPFAVHLDLVMVADHPALRRATIHKVAASALAVISVQLGVKLHMPPIVADPVISVLRPRGDAEEYGNHAGYRHPTRRNHKNFPQQDDKTPARRLAGMIPRGGRSGWASNGLFPPLMIR